MVKVVSPSIWMNTPVDLGVSWHQHSKYSLVEGLTSE